MKQYRSFAGLLAVFLLTGLFVSQLAFAAPASAYLADLQVEGVELSTPFRPTTLLYMTSVPESTSSLLITATPEDPEAQIDITGNTNLSPGINQILIKVSTSEDSLTYTLTVTKEGDVSPSSSRLKTLSVKEASLIPTFSSDLLSYTIDVTAATNRLDIEAIPENPNAKIAITGDKDLKEGLNVVSVAVTSEDGSKEATYTIEVTKMEDPEKVMRQAQNKERAKLLLIIIPAILLTLAIATGTIFALRKRKAKTK